MIKTRKPALSLSKGCTCNWRANIMKKTLVIFLFFVANLIKSSNQDSLLKVAANHKIDSAYVMILTEIAGNYDDLGDYDKSITYCFRAKKIADSLHYKFGQQSALNNLGNSYLDRGEIKKALECHIQVLKLREELGNKVGIAYSYLNLGNIYFRVGNEEKALQSYEQSIKILYGIGDTLRVATCLSNMGSIFSNQGKVKEAESYYLKSLAIKKRFKDDDGIAEIYSNLSIILMDAAKYTQALDYAFQTIPLYGEAGSKLGKAIAYSNIGDIYDHMGDLNNAIKYQEISLQLAKEMQTSYMLETCYQLLATAYSKKNDYKNAVMYAELFSRLRDSVMSSENSKQITEMQTRFETGKKEKEIELLQKDKSIRDLEISKQDSSIKRQRIIIYTVIGGFLLVIALISMILRSNRQRKKINIGLETKNEEIELQKSLIEEKNKMITDSIDYARTIQNAILPPVEKIKAHFPESFIVYEPKDIVSGDFYWLFDKRQKEIGSRESERNTNLLPSDDCVLFATVDCVGHGVPGAFMSVMVNSMLENCIDEKAISKPELILDELNAVIKTLNTKSETIKYGLDISLIAYNSKKMELQFAGTKMPLVIIRDNKTLAFSSDTMAIGAAVNNYKSKTISLQKGDRMYMFTDGASSGTEFIETLPYLASKSMEEQKLTIKQKIEMTGSQADDVLVVGIRV